jgi:hypothetical protein
MADPVRLSIRLDEPGEWDPDAGGAGPDVPVDVRTGERISGTVEVTAVEDVEFTTFRIGLCWRTEGKGNRASGSGGAVSLVEEGFWRAGVRALFPFSLRAPWGPVSYAGKILKVIWRLEATVDRSMLRSDVRAAIPVRLLADPEAEKTDLGPKAQKKGELEAVKRGLGGLWLTLAVLCLLGGVVFGASQNWDLEKVEQVLLVIFLVGGFLLMLLGIWGRLGRGKLGEPTVHLSTTDLRLGEPLLFSLALRPDRRTELRSLEAILECEERVVHGHGQYRSNHRKMVYEKRLSLAQDVTIEPHRGFRRKGTLTLPEDGSPSFGAPDNQVVWWLRFEGDIVGWPDWKEPFLLTVRP